MGYKSEILHCKGCTYCQRAHRDWSSFAETVDDALPFVGTISPIEQLRLNQFMTNLDENEAVRY